MTNDFSNTRRAFLATAAAATTAMTAAAKEKIIKPGISAKSAGRTLGANDRIRVGMIGVGIMGTGHLREFVKQSDADKDIEVVAVSDVYKRHRERAQGISKLDAKNIVLDYREVLGRSDVDAVLIATPDHWHAQMAIDAFAAGKDVYLQKPMTMTHAEGVLLREAVVKSGRIFQLGSQQRSSPQFRRACELVRSGRVGRLQRVEIGLPIDPTAPDNAPQAVPPQLAYERWLGPTPQAPYTEQRVHPVDGYDRPGWLRNDAYCLGMITGWGAHHYDILHWALDTELGGPLTIEGRADFPANKIWNVHGAYEVQLTYPGQVRVTVSDKLPNGLKFIGDEGWIFVSRGSVATKDPKVPRGRLRPLDASDDKLLDPKGVAVQLPQSSEHHENWLECVRSRRAPMVPAPVAHRSNTACIVSWIAMKLGRRLTWDARAERFVDDAAANAMLTRPERAPYGALRLAAARG